VVQMYTYVVKPLSEELAMQVCLRVHRPARMSSGLGCPWWLRGALRLQRLTAARCGLATAD
jgi:hypothetical protein